MRLKSTALVASALAGLAYVAASSASALPAPSRADIVSPRAKTGVLAEEVRYGRRGYRRWGHRRGYGYGYRPRYYGYSPYYYGGYGYRPYYYGGYGYPYYRRPGFGIYLGF